jgi:hypothetical protein
MELLVTETVPFTPDHLSIINFLDMNISEVLNLILADIRLMDDSCFDTHTEKVISQARGHWNDPNYAETEIKLGLAIIEAVVKTWFFKLPLAMQCYFYCRNVKHVELTSEKQFSNYFVEVDALAEDNYRRSPASVSESLQRLRTWQRNR